MASIRENNWTKNYKKLRDFVLLTKQFPAKSDVENLDKLNWWKYQKKRAKLGKLTDEQRQLLLELHLMRAKKKSLDYLEKKID